MWFWPTSNPSRHPQDAVADVRGDVAWVTLTLPSVGRPTLRRRRRPGSEAGICDLCGEFHPGENIRRVELGHTSQLPPDCGVEPDFQRVHGGMKFAEVADRGPAAKAGFQIRRRADRIWRSENR